MKKLIALTTITAAIVATSAFGQGFVQFTTGKSQAWDGFTTAGSSALSSKVNVALFWAAQGSTPTVASLLASTPTSGNSTTVESYTAAQAWTDILNGGFTLGQNASSGNANVIQLTAANGGIQYFGGSGFNLAGTAANTAYAMYFVSWDATYATPALAAAANGGAGAAVGWSSVFTYTTVANTGTPSSMSGLAPQFGTFVPVSAPEPSTMALAGLGGAAMLLFRRRK
jgi:PEP-CTERM motif